jgi:hypothetical protein
VAEFDQMLDGALWREERFRELLAWHALHVMSASGAKSRGGGPLTMELILNRGYIPGPHYQPVDIQEPDPVKTRDDKPSASTPVKSVDPLTIRLEQLAKRGFQVTRVQ